MKKVLIIGANSYIGNEFNNYIEKNYENCISVEKTRASDGTWEKVDFCQYDVIIHLAAIVHKKENIKMKELYYKVNYELAIEVAKKARECKVKQFIFISTQAIYGDQVGCITNNTKPNPNTEYGKSKFLAEENIKILSDKDFGVAIVRPPMVYGNGCKGNYSKLIKYAKYIPILPNYQNKRSVIHINVLCEYITKIIIDDVTGYFHPQNKDYENVCSMIFKIRTDQGKRTLLVTQLNFIISILKDKVHIFRKLFNDLYYDKYII